MFHSFEGSLVALREQVAALRKVSQLPESQLFTVRSDVSGWSPAEHVDHCLKVAQSVVTRIGDPEAAPAATTISLLGRVILTCGWIPRGKGKSPERLRGAASTTSELEERFAKVETVLAAVTAPAGDRARLPIVPHPRFGGLTATEALRFAVIHTKHHLKIVQDVLAK